MTEFQKFRRMVARRLQSPEEWIRNNNDCSDNCPAWHSCRYDLNHDNEKRCMKAFVEWANREAK